MPDWTKASDSDTKALITHVRLSIPGEELAVRRMSPGGEKKRTREERPQVAAVAARREKTKPGGTPRARRRLKFRPEGRARPRRSRQTRKNGAKWRALILTTGFDQGVRLRYGRH
jgi:hypothetical protein